MKNILFYLLMIFVFAVGCQRQNKQPNLKELGQSLYLDNNCITCHSIDGTEMIGPSLKDIFGTVVSHTDGSNTVVNEDYIIESIIYPHKKIVKGYPDQMNSYKDLLSEHEIKALVEYIKNLSN